MAEPPAEAPAVEAPPVRSDGLQLEEHRSFQEKMWTIERWGWAGFGVIIVAALLGVTGGGGYLAHARAQIEGGEIDYPRFARWDTGEGFKVIFAAGEEERALTLSPAFADAFQIEDIRPAPERSQARPDGDRMIFRLIAGAPATVHIHVRAVKPGLARFKAAIDDGARQDITAIVLP